MSDQKRNYSRIETFFQGRLRIIPPGDAFPLFRGCPGCEMAQGLATRPKAGNVPEALIDFMETINSKLDMLLSLANQELLQNTFHV